MIAAHCPDYAPSIARFPAYARSQANRHPVEAVAGHNLGKAGMRMGAGVEDLSDQPGIVRMGAGVEYLSDQPGIVNSSTQHRHQVPPSGHSRIKQAAPNGHCLRLSFPKSSGDVTIRRIDRI